ncbi:MAG: DNA methyltransferase [Defluviicoccus sp.]
MLDTTETQTDDPAKALLKLSVIDPACGSGHFLLAAARRIATRLARIRAEGTPSLADFRHALRDVARSCVHGVDRNPMAVELTKVALWIETVDPGLPLGFFDAQIRCGDSLLGVFDLKVLQDGIPDAAYKPLTGDDKDVAKYYVAKNKREKAERDRIATGFGFNRARDLMRDFAALRAMPEDTVDEIEAKAACLRSLTGQGAAAWQLETACDLYIAGFLLPKVKGGTHAGPDGMPRRGAETVPTSGSIWEWLRGVSPFGPMFGAALDASRTARAFHWPLEFPDVMQRGGFDVVLGNPPWERIKLQEQEFFAARSPEIANAPNKAARDRLIKALASAAPGSADRALFDAFTEAKREAEATSEFVRVPGEDGGRFALTGRGDVNTYALFAELFANLARQHAGVIVPTGIATDATTAPFFAHLVEKQRLTRLVDFENSAPIFPSVHRSFKFALLTLGRDAAAAHFAFFLTAPAQLAEPERNFTLSPTDIAAINPNTRTAPVFRSRADAELTAKIYSNAPVLIDESKGAKGNLWGAFYLRLIHYGDHSEELYTEERAITEGFELIINAWQRDQETLLPIYESKFVNLLDHRYATSDSNGETSEIDKKANPNKELYPRYWVTKQFFDDLMTKYKYRRGWLLAYRDIARSNDVRTMITTAIPKGPASVNLPTLGFSDEHPGHALLANMASLSLDFVARQSISGAHMTFGVLKQLPILPPDFYTEPRLAFITPKVLELTYTSHSLAPFARDLGHDGPPFAWDEDRRAHLRADLDAFYARAYGLTRDELRYILDPADARGCDYPSETFRVLKDKEIRTLGEYRTQRLVLAAWDRMEANGEFTAMGM